VAEPRDAGSEEHLRRRHPFGLLRAEPAVAVAVEEGEQFLHVFVPRLAEGGAERLAVDVDVQTDQHRPSGAEEDDVLHVVGVGRRGRGTPHAPLLQDAAGPGQEVDQEGQGEEPRSHDSTPDEGPLVTMTAPFRREPPARGETRTESAILSCPSSSSSLRSPSSTAWLLLPVCGYARR